MTPTIPLASWMDRARRMLDQSRLNRADAQPEAADLHADNAVTVA